MLEGCPGPGHEAPQPGVWIGSAGYTGTGVALWGSQAVLSEGVFRKRATEAIRQELCTREGHKQGTDWQQQRRPRSERHLQ